MLRASICALRATVAPVAHFGRAVVAPRWRGDSRRHLIGTSKTAESVC